MSDRPAPTESPREPAPGQLWEYQDAAGGWHFVMLTGVYPYRITYRNMDLTAAGATDRDDPSFRPVTEERLIQITELRMGQGCPTTPEAEDAMLADVIELWARDAANAIHEGITKETLAHIIAKAYVDGRRSVRGVPCKLEPGRPITFDEEPTEQPSDVVAACSIDPAVAETAKALLAERPSEEKVEWKWRVGRKLGRTLYFGDILHGLLDSPEIAKRVADAMNVAAQPTANPKTGDPFDLRGALERIAGMTTQREVYNMAADALCWARKFHATDFGVSPKHEHLARAREWCKRLRLGQSDSDDESLAKLLDEAFDLGVERGRRMADGKLDIGKLLADAGAVAREAVLREAMDALRGDITLSLITEPGRQNARAVRVVERLLTPHAPVQEKK